MGKTYGIIAWARQLLGRFAARLLAVFPVLRPLAMRVYFGFCKCTIPPSGLDVLFLCDGGNAFSGDVRAICSALAQDELYSAMDLVVALTPSARKRYGEFFATTPQARPTLVGTDGCMRNLARAKYWITNGPLPTYVKPGKEHVWILTSQSTPDVCTPGNAPTGEKDKQHAARYASYILADAPVFKPDVQHFFDLAGTDETKDSVCTLAPLQALPYCNARQQDTFRWKMQRGVPLGQTAVLLSLADNCAVAQQTKQLTASGCFAFRPRRSMGAQGTETDADIDTYLEIAASDVVVTDSATCVVAAVRLGKPVVLYAASCGSGTAFTRMIGAMPHSSAQTAEDATGLALRFAGGNDAAQKKEAEWLQGQTEADDPVEFLHRLVVPQAKSTERQRRHAAWQEFFNRSSVWTLGSLRAAGISRSPNVKRLRALKNKYAGQRCVLAGNGPSLTARDLEAIRGEITFGCNLIYKAYEFTSWRPDYFFIIDSMYIKHHSAEISRSVDAPVFTVAERLHLWKKRPQNLMWSYLYKNDHYRPFCNPPMGVDVQKSTVMVLMIEMAIYMGFSEIYLIGVDASNTNSTTAPTHFIDNHFNQDTTRILQKRSANFSSNPMTLEESGQLILDHSLLAYAGLQRYAERHGVKIYNATRGGFLEVFPRANLDEVLQGSRYDNMERDTNAEHSSKN